MKTSQTKFWTVLRQCHEERPFLLLGGEVLRQIVRQRYTFDCPVIAVARKLTGEKFKDNCWEPAAEEMGLDKQFALNITYAADFTMTTRSSLDLHQQQKLRRKLLSVLGLVEE